MTEPRLECWCLIETPTHGGGVNPHCPQHGTTLDEERLARALNATVGHGWLRCTPPDPVEEWRMNAAAIAKAYREDTDHE